MSRVLQVDAVLVCAAMIWGFSYVVQSLAMKSLGPFTFTGLRFLLAAAVLLPVVYKRAYQQGTAITPRLYFQASVSGILLFAGVVLQQIGIIYTSVANAGFITGLYLIVVPVLNAVIYNIAISSEVWIAAGLALLGLYLISFGELGWSASGFGGLTLGDAIVGVSVIFWSLHMIYTEKVSPRHDTYSLATLQFFICGVLGCFFGLLFERTSWDMIEASYHNILYGGVVAVAIGFTLQIYGQSKAPAHHVAFLLSLEVVFAVISGYIFLGERLSALNLIGGAIIFFAIIFVQIARIVQAH